MKKLYKIKKYIISFCRYHSEEYDCTMDLFECYTIQLLFIIFKNFALFKQMLIFVGNY